MSRSGPRRWWSPAVRHGRIRPVADTRDRLPDWERLLAAERHLSSGPHQGVATGESPYRPPATTSTRSCCWNASETSVRAPRSRRSTRSTASPAARHRSRRSSSGSPLPCPAISPPSICTATKVSRSPGPIGLMSRLGTRVGAAAGQPRAHGALMATSRPLWNRAAPDLGSDELLAQMLDLGDLHDWRALYRLARGEAQLRARIGRLVRTVPLPLPHFWLAALASLGEPVDWDVPVPDYYASTTI